MGRFEHCRVLLVEDEALVAFDVENILCEAGCETVGPFAAVTPVLKILGEEKIDAAILDINLGRELVYPVAEALASAGVPFVWLSGHAVDFLPEHHRHRPFVGKPYLAESLLAALASVLIRTCESQAL